MPINISKEQILAALRDVKHPKNNELGLDPAKISGLTVKNAENGAEVRFVIAINPDEAETFEPLRQAAEEAVRQIEGVFTVHAVLTAHKKQLETPKPRVVIAVASGKGGVGKSTTAVNLALAMAGQGAERSLKVGLLDADIYGPSVPRLLGVRERPTVDSEKKIVPIVRFGIELMSMGFLVDEETPIAWRGPMIHGALKQMIHDVAWGALDVLVVDMPPGTGDVPLSLGREADLSGAVIVSTPQDIALLDARKSLAMFQKMEVPILGIVENMSFFLCPHCGERSDVFGHGGAKADAERLKVPFLGEIPLAIELRETSDAGTPIVRAKPDSKEAQIYRAIAEKILAAVPI